MTSWVIAIGIVFLGGSVAAELGRRRRLRRFGDPALLGARDRPAARLVAALLLATGASATAAVIPQADSGPKTGSSRPSKLVFLIDSTWEVNSADGRAALLESIRSVAQTQRGSAVSIVRSANGPEQVVAATLDTEGALVLLDRVSHDWVPGVRNRLQDDIAALRKDAHDQKLVILTALPVEEVQQLPSPVALIVRLADEGELEFAVPAANGEWTWTRDAREMASLSRAQAGEGELLSWLRSRSAAQISAGAAFLLLALGSLWESAPAARPARDLPAVPGGR
jgi:hypothetical protein